MFEPLSALVRLRRSQLGLSLDALSALSGVSRTRLVTLEKGDDNISLDLLLKVANAMKITELQIGGLHVEPAAPELHALVAAAEAIQAARRVIAEAAAAAKDLERVAAPVYELLAPILPPSGTRDIPSARLNVAAAARIFRRRRRARRPVPIDVADEQK